MPKRPSRLRSEAYGAYILNDANASAGALAVHRAQRAEHTVDLAVEDLYELANEGVVEHKTDIPSVSITMSGNQIAQDIASDSISGLHWLGLISNNKTTDTTREKVFAIGDPLKYHASSTATITTVDDFNYYVASDNMPVTCDMIFPIRDESALRRTYVINQAYTTALSWSFDVGGVATWDCSLEADNRTAYLDASKAVDVDSHQIVTAEVTGNSIPITSPAAGQLFSVYLNGEKLDVASTTAELNQIGVRKYYWPDELGYIKVTSVAELLSVGNIVRYTYVPAASAPSWSSYELTTTPSDQGGIRKGEMDIYLITNTTLNRVVEGFETSIGDAGGTYLWVSPGRAYIQSGSTGNLELYTKTSASSLAIAGATDADFFLLSNAAGNMIMVTSTSGGTGTNAVYIASITAAAGPIVTSVVDARQFRRNKLSLIQSASFSADLSREIVEELGNEKVVDRLLTKPIPVTVDFSANDADGEITAYLAGATWADGESSNDEIETGDYSDSIGIQVNMYTSTSRTDSTKQLIVEAIDLMTTSDGISAGVGASGELSVSMTGDNLRAFEVV